MHPRIGEFWRTALGALASLIVPAPCRICGQQLETISRIPVCQLCLGALRPLPAPLCQQCGRPFPSAWAAMTTRPLCQLCRRGVYSFDQARSYGAYDDAMVRAIVLLKYHAVEPLGGWFARRLAERMETWFAGSNVQLVVPVPLHPSRLRERGYNQAELIARPLAKRLGLPMRPYLLVRTKPRPNKLKLTRRERWLTVRGAYATRQGSRVDKARILLVDDVFTTGATLDACAQALRKAGAERIVAVTAARVVAFWVSLGQGDAAGTGPNLSGVQQTM